MLEARWARAAEAMWARSREAAASFNVEELARYGFRVRIVRLPRLRLSAVAAWLQARQLDPEPCGTDRPLHGCLVAPEGRPYIFLDQEDPPPEQRYTLAHELAHLWQEREGQRERARRWLGDAILDVLDGRRGPTMAERVAALVHRVPLLLRPHLLERDGELGLVDGGILLAEEEADRLALELLAPGESALATLRLLPAGTPWSDWLALAGRSLEAEFALPPAIARAYARTLAPAAGAGPSFWERLAGGVPDAGSRRGA